MALETIRIEGVQEILSKMDSLAKNLRRSIGRDVIRKSLAPLLEVAQARTPVKYGELKEAWKVKTWFNEKLEAAGAVTNTRYTALFIENGHKIVKITRKGQLRRGRYTGGREKRVVGFATAKPMLRPAFDVASGYAVRIAAEELEKAVDKAVLQAGVGR